MTSPSATARGKLASSGVLLDRSGQNAVALSLVIFFVLLSILSSAGVSSTTDEPVHYAYAMQLMDGHATRIDESSMPVSILNALPKRIAVLLAPGRLQAAMSSFFVARMVTILFSAALSLLVFFWSRSLYGFIPAVFSTSLYVLDPNVIAHSQLITTDVYVAGFTALTFYFLWRFANTGRTSAGLLCAIALGLSQLTKYTAVTLYPLCLAALVLHDFPPLLESFRTGGLRPVLQYGKKILIFSIVAAAVSILIINVGFWFSGTLTRFKDYRFQSVFFEKVQTRLSWLGQVPVPLPYPYVDGLDWGSYTEQTGNRFGNVYLLGQTRKPEGFVGYFFVAGLLKEPIATQALVAAALVAVVATRKRRRGFFRDTAFLLVPVAGFAVYFNFFLRHDVGYRYCLIYLPLLFVLAGTLFTEWNSFAVWRKAASLALVVYLGASVLSYFPYYIPYFNELVWDKTQTYKYLADSNLDWGQSTDDVARYRSEHPDAVLEPASPQAGLIVVGGSDLVGILTQPGQFAWLRDNFKPVSTIDYAYFVYEISPQQIAALCASSNYCR